jgi:hypothetical protein
VTFTAVPFPGQPASQGEWQVLGGLFAPSGLPADSAAVTVTGRDFVVPSGMKALISGFLGTNNANLSVTGTTNTNTNPRIDRLVFRLDTVVKTITPVILQGTPAASPVPPTITNPNDIPGWRARMPGSASAQNYDTLLAEWMPLSTDRRRNAFRSTGAGNTWGPGNNSVAVATWTNNRVDGLVTRSGSSFTLDRPGRWSLSLKVHHSSTTAGSSTIRLSWPGGPWLDDFGPMEQSLDGDDLTHDMSWEGLVLPSECGAANPLQVLPSWTPVTGTAKATYSFDFYAEYAGG